MRGRASHSLSGDLSEFRFESLAPVDGLGYDLPGVISQLRSGPVIVLRLSNSGDQFTRLFTSDRCASPLHSRSLAV